MNLRAKKYVEEQKKNAQAQLAKRLAFLKEKALDPKAVQKDATLRKIKALIRKADFRLATIAAQEKLNQELAQAKIEKLAAKAAKKEEGEKPKEEAPEAAGEKKGKKEKKEKKAKPEKGEKQEKPEKKKEKEVKKAEEGE